MSGVPAAAKALAEAASSSGIFTDFDGCLAPIVSDPERARAVRGTSALLAKLARRFKVVSIVSGRSAADLARRIRAPGVRLVGLHGMEELRDGEVVTAPVAEAARAAVEQAGAQLAVRLRGVRGAILERKGLALAVHFRRAADPDAAERLAAPIVAEAAIAAGLEVLPGRRILEVRPKHAGDKGDAVRRIAAAERLAGALVGGDDVGDIAAFDAVEELSPRLRVAVASDEAPAALVERADLVMTSPREFVALLRSLAP